MAPLQSWDENPAPPHDFVGHQMMPTGAFNAQLSQSQTGKKGPMWCQQVSGTDPFRYQVPHQRERTPHVPPLAKGPHGFWPMP